jgi:spermidine synthase
MSTMRQKASEWRNPEFFTRNVWFTDKDDFQALSLRFTGEVFFDVQSPFQRVRIIESYKYGKMLALDDMVMTTIEDEFHYHEMISHPALFTHGNAKNILVIGGGDGGTVREILRHEGVEKVTMVEIDGEVITACKEHLPQIAAAFDDPRLDLIVDDGIAFIKNAAPESYDLVIVDGSDPVGPAEGLFSVEFYTNCYNSLTKDGILVAQGESPKFNEKAFTELNHTLQDIFGTDKAPVSLFFVPTYPTGMWSFQYGIKGERHPKHISNESEIDAFVDNKGLRYYNADVHKGSFSTPNFVKTLLKK